MYWGTFAGKRAVVFCCLLTAIPFAAAGCADHKGSSSASADHARSRELLIAEYDVPMNALLGEYRILECWVEKHHFDGKKKQLSVRFMGPHRGDIPSVKVDGLAHRSIWSEHDGPRIEVWDISGQVPESLTLRNGQETLVILVHKMSPSDT